MTSLRKFRFFRGVVAVIGVVAVAAWLFFGFKGVAWVQVLPLALLVLGSLAGLLFLAARGIARWVWNG